MNPDQLFSWKTLPAQGNGGSIAAGMRIRNNFTVGARDGLVTPPLNLSGFDNMDLQFEYAYAKYFQSYTDSLIVFASVDCGETWERIFADGDDGTGNFATAPRTEEEFFPMVADDWCGHGYGAHCINLRLNDYLGFDKVRVKFEIYSQLGNNLYLDNILIVPNVGLPDINIKYNSAFSNILSKEKPLNIKIKWLN